ncbi:phage tail length tape measure family protein [Shinella oryzae]|uniref:Phage tail length tape measure family protein n=1 Tax=Shinella oryzae TaxID=2871820 RepID=A0ABY9JZJ5_9HYPH|nr:phage tail length tape measure family protein [Shinella oryzae]WLS01750.1 phage tail length tape measure family protein [Shinella oryzae]
MDVARLGIEVSSNGVGQAAGELTRLTNAARVAQRAVAGLSDIRNASAAALSAARAAQGQASATLAAAKASETATRADIDAARASYNKAKAATLAAKADHDRVNASYAVAKAQQVEANAAMKAAQASMAANNNVKRMGGSMSGLAAQFQDVGVTAAGGMNPMLIALQQGTQIAGQMEAAMEGGAKATAVFATAFKSLLSPISLASIALTALAAAGLQMVDWAKLGASAVRGLADVLVTIAPYAATAAAGLALLYAPTIVLGIMNVIALLGRMAVAAVSAGIAIAAANPLGAFVLGVTAAVAAMNIFRNEITQIFGRDIVADVKNAANFVINSFEAAFEDLKFIWNTFPDVIKAAVVGAANAALAAVESLIQKAANLMDAFHAQVNKILPEGIQIPQIGKISLGNYKVDDGGAAERVAKGLDGRNANIERIMGQDRVGQFGEGIARGASAASGKLQELAKWMTTVDEKKKKSGGKTDAEKYSDIVDGANRRLASLKAEELALGMTEQASLSLRYETDLLNEAQQKGITLTAKQRGELNSLAGQMAVTEIATKKAKEAMEFAKSTALGFVNDLRNGLKNGEGFWKSFGNAALNVLDRITDKLLGDVMDAIFKVGNAGGGSGGLLGTIFGGLFGGGSQFGIASAGGIGLYADGTASARAGLAMVGEEGPELVRFKGGEKVIPNHQLHAVNDNGSSGQGISVSAPVEINIDATGADAAGLARVERQLASLKAELPNQIVSTVQNAQKRRGL